MIKHREEIRNKKFEHWHSFMEEIEKHPYVVIRKQLTKDKDSYRLYQCACCKNNVNVGLFEDFGIDEIVLCEICYSYYAQQSKVKTNPKGKQKIGGD